MCHFVKTLALSLRHSHKTFGGQTQFWEMNSICTQTPMRFATFVPEGPVKGALLWLSGRTCTEENFITKAGAQKYLAEHQMMVICPDTSPRGLNLPGEHESELFGSGAGYYVNATTPHYKDHYRMYDHINSEIYSVLTDHFKMNKIGIAGHSMGGHGALVIGLRNAFRYTSISALAPGCHPTRSPNARKALTGYLGSNEEDWAPYDATVLIRDAHRHPKPILIDQGTADPYLETGLLTPHFEKACQSMRQPQVINYQEGYDHEYYFVATFIESHIRFHASAFV